MHQFNQILSSLNPEQLDAVSHTEGALLVLAGAGTGKTKVLTTRIAYILQNRLAWPSQILAVTFTNKAAKEMEHRIHQMVGDISAGLWLGTFHSISLKILRKYPLLVGLKENFSVINSEDQLRLIKEIMLEKQIDVKKFNPKAISAQINRWKDRAVNHESLTDDSDLAAEIYQDYQRRCELLNIIDFGDIILKCINLFRNNEDILSEFHNKFKYILVDEYQDTNTAQYLWLRLLAQAKQNICCVGDDDQSIYGWRGAEVGNILRFEKDFANPKIIRLETNYRSTTQILAGADAVIANNQNRLGKILKANNGSGDAIKLVSLWDDRSEANYIADEIEAQQQIYKKRLDNMAILVRAGYQTRAFEECFIRRAIPYRILGGLRFYERMEIRDVVAYVRACITPENDLAIDRIINLPKRGLGEKTLNDLKKFASNNNISLFDAIYNNIYSNEIEKDFSLSFASSPQPNSLPEGVEDLFSLEKNPSPIGRGEGVRANTKPTLNLKPKVRETLKNFVDDLIAWKNDFVEQPHAKVVEKIVEDSGYKSMWESEKTIEAKGRLENIKELINAISQFSDIYEFLEHISLVADADDRPVEDMISIMTIHGAKGLEFDNVFLPGWEEGLFPSQQSLDELGREGLEEERRLAYVAITRAKKNLTISFASSRMVFGNIVNSVPSRFVDELPEDAVEVINKAGLGANYKGKSFSAKQGENNLSEKPARFEIPSINNGFNSKKINDNLQNKFSVGDKVNHPVFGFGRVLNINGKHLQIVFEKAAIKTLLEDFIEKVA